jgi:seryl-tRNA synthetase
LEKSGFTRRKSVAELIVDGIKIDTTIWIDSQIARFQDQSEAIGIRRKSLSKEIARSKAELQEQQTAIPRDIHGEAHAKAYIGELERLERELTDEWERKVKEVTGTKRLD